MLDINKQAMKYSLQGQTVLIYERDDDGNILYEGYTDSEGNFIPYLDDEGNKIPKVLEEKTGFSEPTDFKANISFSGGEAQSKEYGFDAADFYDNVCALCRRFGNLLDTQQHLVGYSAKIYYV